MSKKFDVVAITGTYTDRNGQEKPRYLNIGVVLATKKGGFALKLESIPTSWDGWAQLYEPKAKESYVAVGDQGEPVVVSDEFSDRIPF